MTNSVLRTILPVAGWPEARAGEVEITGGADPILRTPFRVGETAAATLAAVGIAVSDLWALRTGRQQGIAIDTRRAAASLRSGHYLKIDGAHVSPEPDPIMGNYPAQHGRWSYLHCNFPHHRAVALKVLGVPEDRAAVRKAVARWDALQLEEAIIAAGGAGGMVRTREEWLQHPQGLAVAALPLMEIVKIGDSAPEPLPAGERPLSGIRVLDLTRVIAGPTCGRTLAEHGADVLKISAAHLPSLGRQEYDTGHGKLSAYLDLREASDNETLRGLARGADVFSQGYRPGSLANRGYSPEALAALRPGIVVVSLSAFGHTGPWAARRGFDTVIQTVSGMTLRQGACFPGAEPGPQFYPMAAIDFLTGYLMACGAMVALARRAREGGSWLVRISLAQVGRWLVSFGEVPERELRSVPRDFTPGQIERWSMVSETPAGRLQHLAPVLQLSETAPRWARPMVPLGHHRPEWPA